LNQEKLRELDTIFYPQSIAIVGVSQDEQKMGNRYLRALLSQGFKGKIYPVNPNSNNILGLKTYPNLQSIPEPVDYVYVTIPRDRVLSLLDDCAAKKVKAVGFFTAGFSETGEKEGIELEKEILKKAQEGGFRIIGPNCLGIYSPRANIPCSVLSGLLGEVGSIAFLSQSGSIILRTVQKGIASGVHFSKAVNFGNGCDLDSIDFLEYFASDPETKVIGAYLEGVRDGSRFLQTIKEISKRKPLVIWKGGKTETGIRAATSHTGALTSSALIWKVALKQAGVIEVHNLEGLVDTLLAFQELPLLRGYAVTVISGLVNGGGGQSVSAADTCGYLGLELPPFRDKTKKQLNALLGQVGTILHNPLDVSQALTRIETIRRAIEIASADQGINLIIIQENVDLILRLQPGKWTEQMSDMIVALRNKRKKPIVVVLEAELAEAERMTMARKLLAAHIPVFPTLERAAKAIANMSQYSDYLKYEV